MADPPKIVEEPESLTLMIGEIIELKCAAAYEAGLKYSWRKADGQIPVDRNQVDTNEQGSTIRILDAEATDSGTYICRVSNARGGAIEVSASVHIQMQPSLSRRPQDVITTVGSTASLHCEAHGYPQPTITWRKDGQPLPQGRNSVKEGMLFIMNVQFSDSGTYECTARNTAGSVNVSAVIRVYETPRFLEYPEDVTAASGSEVEFRCRVHGVPMPTISWSKSSGDLPMDRVNIASDGSLHLRNIENTDVDIYTCTAGNYVGAISAAAQLEVLVKPTIHAIAPPRFVAEVGEDALFMCKFSGHPRPMVLWYKNGTQNLMSADDSLGRFQVTEDGTMLIAAVTNGDQGDYVCRVKNGAGMTELASHLEVIPAGTKGIRELPDESITVQMGGNVTLSCSAIGDSQAMVEWSLNGTKINTEDNGFTTTQHGGLFIRDVTSSHEGIYRCAASHVWGTRVNLVTLSVDGPPAMKPEMTTRAPLMTTQEATDMQSPAMASNAMEEDTEVNMPPTMAEPEISTEEPPKCQPCTGQPSIKARRYDITNPGLEGYFRGWVDVQGQGAANDYCRIIAAGDAGFQLSCALAGTEGESEHNYQSTPDLDVGFEGTWYMKDEDGDNRDDYCRCVGEGDNNYVWCMKAGNNGFFGKDEKDPSSGSQYSFKAPGKKRELKHCENRIVDPFLGITAFIF